jgi:hypothetical protein
MRIRCVGLLRETRGDPQMLPTASNTGEQR